MPVSPTPTLLGRLKAELRSLVAQTAAAVERFACVVAKALLRDAIQAFLDGVGIDCPECLPVLVPFASALYLTAVAEIERVCGT